MIEIAELLPPQPGPLWTLVKQTGVTNAIGILPYGEIGPEVTGAQSWTQIHGSAVTATRTADGERLWDYGPLLHLKTRYEDAGFKLAAIESSPPMDKIRLGLPGRDEEIEDICLFLRNMGVLDIPVWCYNFLAKISWGRTSFTTRGRGGALVSSYDHELMRKAPLTDAGVVTEEQMWENLAYFLERVIPVAEEAGVKMAMHPDDPPLSPFRGIGRIRCSLDNFQRLIDLVPSDYNGITFCQGNFALMTDDVPAAIRHFGRQNKIFFVHYRDVRGRPEKFSETFHDEGQTDMLACMRAYKEVGFTGVLRPDHVPTIEGDSNDNPGYSSLGRLFAIGYIKGLREAVFAEVQEG